MQKTVPTARPVYTPTYRMPVPNRHVSGQGHYRSPQKPVK